MKEHGSRFEFRARLNDDLTIAVPMELAAALRPGRSVVVSIRSGDPRAGRERQRTYSDREVDGIAGLQAETAEAVRKCLDAQGTLSRSRSFARRFAAPRRGREG